MRALALALALAGTAACKQAKEPPPAGELLTKARALAATACACTDAACVTPLLAQWNALTSALGGSGQLAGGTFTDEQVEGLVTEDERFMKCAARFATGAPAPSRANGAGSAASDVAAPSAAGSAPSAAGSAPSDAPSAAGAATSPAGSAPSPAGSATSDAPSAAGSAPSHAGSATSDAPSTPIAPATP